MSGISITFRTAAAGAVFVQEMTRRGYPMPSTEEPEAGDGVYFEGEYAEAASNVVNECFDRHEVTTETW